MLQKFILININNNDTLTKLQVKQLSINGYTIKFRPQLKMLDPNTAAQTGKLVVRGLKAFWGRH